MLTGKRALDKAMQYKPSFLDKALGFAKANKGALIGGSLAAPAAGIAYAMSDKNKVRNAALTGFIVGALGVPAGMLYDKYVG